MSNKPILCLDFDGVCHSYESGWKGAGVIPDPPVPGLFEFLEEADKVFTVQIFSSRSNQPGGMVAMMNWFDKYWTEYLFQKQPETSSSYPSGSCPLIQFVDEKPPAFLTIDDRAITFTGEWPDIQELRKFQPWFKRGG
jgi:hypothetical protein